jgi:hypothetical protein
MPSALPTAPALTKTVKTFGLGPYDAQRDDEMHGEDDEEREPVGETLPQAGGPLDPFGPDRYLSYPDGPSSSTGKHASAILPGDENRPQRGRKLVEDTIDDDIPSVAVSELPEEEDNPPARSDYYDPMHFGKDSDNIWPDEDSGAYANDEEESLPGAEHNDVTMKNWLDALGNAWSGYVCEDMNVPRGFPSEDYSENVDYQKTNDGTHGGRVMAGRIMRTTYDDPSESASTPRTATDLKLVEELTKTFLKKHGKKGITRRAVTEFLQEEGRGDRQYLASDIVRCLKHSHKIVIPDVLDTFPVAKTASSRVNISADSVLSNTYDQLIDLEIQNVHVPEIASVLRRCAATLVRAMIGLERIENRNG